MAFFTRSITFHFLAWVLRSGFVAAFQNRPLLNVRPPPPRRISDLMETIAHEAILKKTATAPVVAASKSPIHEIPTNAEGSMAEVSSKASPAAMSQQPLELPKRFEEINIRLEDNNSIALHQRSFIREASMMTVPRAPSGGAVGRRAVIANLNDVDAIDAATNSTGSPQQPKALAAALGKLQKRFTAQELARRKKAAKAIAEELAAEYGVHRTRLHHSRKRRSVIAL